MTLGTSRIIKAARLSADGQYRYELTRQWDGACAVLWIMLNPSTADAEIDDPTIRRVMNFSRGWGYGWMKVVNLFALRSSDPRALRDHPDPVGPENLDTLARVIPMALRVVAAWGAVDRRLMLRRPPVEAMAERAGRPIHCLGTTRSGAPRHPLYVPASTPLERFR
ncbi:MAG: DUF1643 domain-containing protein [Actinobacteria bacterium]|nr:DUF1643 domain-containing protein [Actinomycetota bacterium]